MTQRAPLRGKNKQSRIYINIISSGSLSNQTLTKHRYIPHMNQHPAYMHHAYMNYILSALYFHRRGSNKGKSKFGPGFVFGGPLNNVAFSPI